MVVFLFQNITNRNEGISKIFRSGLRDLSKAAKFTYRGYEKISSCLRTQPNLNTLISLNHAEENLSPGRTRQQRFPQTWMTGEQVPSLLGAHESGVKKTPKRITKNGHSRFVCPFCDLEGGSWCGSDSHIRSEHTKIRYGPCTVCKVFTTTNQGSYRKHHRRCKEKTKNTKS